MGASDEPWEPTPSREDTQTGLYQRLTFAERGALLAISNGEALREVEVDRLASLGLLERDEKTGDPKLTESGAAVLSELLAAHQNQ